MIHQRVDRASQAKPASCRPGSFLRLLAAGILLYGRFLYGTNRGHDSVAAYRIGQDGRLSLVAIEPSRGKGPQNLAITPDGAWLLCANMPGNNVAVFRIDPKTGGLKSAGDPVRQSSPSGIMLLP